MNDSNVRYRTELVNSRMYNPQRSKHFRTSYYTEVHFVYNDEDVDIEVKVDTGSPYTIIGTKSRKLGVDIQESIKKIDNSSEMMAEDASGSTVKLKEVIVEKFILTEDIVFPKIRIFFSDDIGEKAILGMDILSLFDFQYVRKDKTFYIHYPNNFLDDLKERSTNKEDVYINPDKIVLIDNVENNQSNKNYQKYTQQDLEANFIQNQINQMPDK